MNEGIFSRSKLLEVENEIVTIQQNINALQLEIEKVKNLLHIFLLKSHKLQVLQPSPPSNIRSKSKKCSSLFKVCRMILREASQVISPYSGRKVVEIAGMTDTLMSQGSTILILEARQEDVELEAVIYFSPPLPEKSTGRHERANSPVHGESRESMVLLQRTGGSCG